MCGVEQSIKHTRNSVSNHYLRNGRFWDTPKKRFLLSSSGTTRCFKTHPKINVSLLAFIHEF